MKLKDKFELIDKEIKYQQTIPFLEDLMKYDIDLKASQKPMIVNYMSL